MILLFLFLLICTSVDTSVSTTRDSTAKRNLLTSTKEEELFGKMLQLLVSLDKVKMPNLRKDIELQKEVLQKRKDRLDDVRRQIKMIDENPTSRRTLQGLLSRHLQTEGALIGEIEKKKKDLSDLEKKYENLVNELNHLHSVFHEQYLPFRSRQEEVTILS